ncbi:MAG TPA: HRDC domain-containing protein [Microlunatus sp.]|nr:HRDC domain-containing protein [Microlunatus sp.]
MTDQTTTDLSQTAPSDSDVELLVSPADGTPPVEESRERLEATIAALTAGTGPIAVDAERAHGFRYTQRAYLIQVRRAGAGTHLIDPVAFDGTPALAELGAAIADAEWVIHAASQDLPCLFEVGMSPVHLFDTELAARLLNYPRVALGTMVTELLGVRLLKEHSAADWSTRPLPDEWLTYAALDVELLVELRDVLAAQLLEAGKQEWAAEEFAALAAGAGTAVEPRTDPWRRTSGIHRVRSRRGLAYVAELWHIRDEIARDTDRAPSKILPDVAIAELAATDHPDRATLYRIAGFQRRQARRYLSEWVAGLQRVSALREAELPPMHIPSPGPPQPRLWAAKDPAAAARLTRVRDALTELATEYELPAENLLTPDYVRRLAWTPPNPLGEQAVDSALAELGARPWQRRLTALALSVALAD